MAFSFSQIIARIRKRYKRAVVNDQNCRYQLARILNSREFQVSDRERRFLAYVVEETLAGRRERIKAYTIGIDVFGRGDDFDATNDPAVRISAGKIRRALERYYLVAGQADSILIAIPKGSYVPEFSGRYGVCFNAR